MKRHIEMDCTHNQAERTMECSWLEGQIRIVVAWDQKTLVIIKDGEVVDRMSLEGMSIEEFMHIEDNCQAAAEQLSQFDDMAS